VKGGAIYLYCFARSGAVRRITARLSSPKCAAGIDGTSRISALELAGVAAFVSRVPAAEFTGASAEAHLADPAWVVKRACQHERVIEEVMGCSPVLPVRFGTIFSSMRALRTRLADRCAEIAAFLDSVAGKEEWGVKGFVELGRAERALLAKDPALRERCRRLPQSPGARYLQEKRLRAEAAAQAKRWCRAVAREVEGELKSKALDMCPVRLQSTSVSGRDAQMVLHYAVLLARRGVARFRACVERIGSVHAEHGLSLELSGPWPPHNFCPSLGELPA
jgi:hypothetical protein